MRNFVFVLFAFIQTSCLQAQFTDSTPHYLRLSASGNLNRSNNSRAYLLANEAKYSIKKRHTTLNTAAAWLYGEQQSNLTNNDFTATADFNIYRDSSRLYYWGLANYTTSFSLKINNQLQSGLGLAYNFINTSDAWLNLSDGILYETSALATGSATVNRYQTFRNSLRISYRFFIGKLVTLSGTNFVQHAFGNAADYIIRSSNSLAIKLNKWIAFTTTATYNQFSRTGTETLLFTYGLTAETFF